MRADAGPADKDSGTASSVEITSTPTSSWLALVDCRTAEEGDRPLEPWSSVALMLSGSVSEKLSRPTSSSSSQLDASSPMEKMA